MNVLVRASLVNKKDLKVVESLNSKTKLYVAVVMLAGLILLMFGAVHWESQSYPRLFAYMAAAAVAGLMRIWIPQFDSAYSLAATFVLLAMASCTFSELLVIGFVAVAAETALRITVFTNIRLIAFHGLAMVCAIAISYYPAMLILQKISTVMLPLAITISAGLIYISYTFLISGYLALKSKVPFFTIWDVWLMTTFIYHLAGSALAILLSIDPRIGDWRLPLAVLPFTYAIYYFNRQPNPRQPQP